MSKHRNTAIPYGSCESVELTDRREVVIEGPLPDAMRSLLRASLRGEREFIPDAVCLPAASPFDWHALLLDEAHPTSRPATQDMTARDLIVRFTTVRDWSRHHRSSHPDKPVAESAATPEPLPEPTFLRTELLRLLPDRGVVTDYRFAGTVALFSAKNALLGRAEFVKSSPTRYDAVRVTILDPRNGPIDHLTLRFSDVWYRRVPDGEDPETPEIRYDARTATATWSRRVPDDAERAKFRLEIEHYVAAFADLIS